MAISLASNRTTALKPPILIHGVHGVRNHVRRRRAEPGVRPDRGWPRHPGRAALPTGPTFDEVMTLAALYTEDHAFRTLVVDSVDWLEPLIHAKVCRIRVESIEDAGYGKGYVHALDLWRQYIEGLNALRAQRKV